MSTPLNSPDDGNPPSTESTASAGFSNDNQLRRDTTSRIETGSDAGRPDYGHLDTSRIEADRLGADRVDDSAWADRGESVPTTVVRETTTTPVVTPPPVINTPTLDKGAILERQRERFGGMKAGSAFFGWLTATGLAVILLALLAAAGVGFGYANTQAVDQAVQEAQGATDTAKTVGLVGGIVLLVILFVAYYAGGYVAGRMARFNGLRQGLAVWLWGIVMVLVVAALAAIAGSAYNIFATLNLPRLPVSEGSVTTAAVIAIAAALLAALAGALLGGLAGMRFHRKVDNMIDDEVDAQRIRS